MTCLAILVGLSNALSLSLSQPPQLHYLFLSHILTIPYLSLYAFFFLVSVMLLPCPTFIYVSACQPYTHSTPLFPITLITHACLLSNFVCFYCLLYSFIFCLRACLCLSFLSLCCLCLSFLSLCCLCLSFLSLCCLCLSFLSLCCSPVVLMITNR